MKDIGAMTITNQIKTTSSFLAWATETTELLQKMVRDAAKVKLDFIHQNNQDTLSVQIFPQDESVGCSFTLQKAFQEGLSPKEAADMVWQMYSKDTETRKQKIAKINQAIADRKFFPTLIGRNEQNAQYLSEIVHEPFMADMEIVYSFYSGMEGTALGHGSLSRKGLEGSRITLDEIREAALTNGPKLLPADIKGLNEDGTIVEPKPGVDSLVLTNSAHVCGAGVITYPGVLRKAAGLVNSSLLLFPSSIHEWLAFSVEKKPEPVAAIMYQRMAQHICIQSNAARKDNILSASVLYYDRAEDKLEEI